MPIIDEVKEWLESQVCDDYDEQAVLADLFKGGGCQSGMVCGLISYIDTVLFFQRNKEEINVLLATLKEETGDEILPILRGYDDEDPLCLETNNQNLLAWFGFEEVAGTLQEDE